MILKHYILRTLKEPINFIMLILFPAVMITIMTVAANNNFVGDAHIINDFNSIATGNTTFNAIFFMFFSGMIVTDYLYLEFRTDMRWRLMASPIPFSKFVASAVGASMIVSVVNTVIVLAFGRFVLDAYLHNIFMTSAVLLTMGIFVTLIGVLCFMLIPKKGTTTAVMMAFAFLQLLPINFNMISTERGILGAANFVPIMAAGQAMFYSGNMWVRFESGVLAHVYDADMGRALIHLGILVGYTVIVAVAVAIVGRTRKI